MYIKLKQTILHIQKLEMKMKQTFILLQRILYQIQNILFDKEVYQSKLDLLSSKQGVGPLLLSFYLTCHLDYLKTTSQPYLLENIVTIASFHTDTLIFGYFNTRKMVSNTFV